jgi:hypothetical protein
MDTPSTKEDLAALPVSTTFTITTMTMTMTMTSIFIAVVTMIMTFITAAPWLAAGTAKGMAKRTPKAAAASTAQMVSAVTFSRRERADRTEVVRTSNRNHATDGTSAILRPTARPSLANRWQCSGRMPTLTRSPMRSRPCSNATRCLSPVS